jgi:hypothetical protein
MSPRVFKEEKFVFWFHSYDVCMKVEPVFTLVQIRKTMQVTLKSGWSRRLKSDGPGVH